MVSYRDPSACTLQSGRDCFGTSRGLVGGRGGGIKGETQAPACMNELIRGSQACCSERFAARTPWLFQQAYFSTPTEESNHVSGHTQAHAAAGIKLDSMLWQVADNCSVRDGG